LYWLYHVDCFQLAQSYMNNTCCGFYCWYPVDRFQFAQTYMKNTSLDFTDGYM